jgi:hypothetical protein
VRGRSLGKPAAVAAGCVAVLLVLGLVLVSNWLSGLYAQS